MLDGGAHFYGVYECKDGKFVSIGSIEPQFYALLRKLANLTDADYDTQMEAKGWPSLKEKLNKVFKSKTRDEWCAIMTRHSSIAMNAVRLLGARYLDMQVRLRELSTEKVERRLAHTILRLAQQAGRRTARGIEIAFPLSRQDLAEMSGTTLHTVSRTLSAWEERGIVDCGRRRIIVARSQLLESIAEEQD